jgi:predicted trehalose synthase
MYVPVTALPSGREQSAESKRTTLRTAKAAGTSRRRLLAAAAGLPLAGASASPALGAVDPHPQWAREMRRLLTELKARPGAVAPALEANRLYHQMWALRELIADTPAKTAGGLIEQINLAIEMHEGGSSLSDTDVRALHTAIASLRRMNRSPPGS